MSKTRVELNTETIVEFAVVHQEQLKQMDDRFNNSVLTLMRSIDGLVVQVVQMNAGVRTAARSVESLAATVGEMRGAIDAQREAIDGHLKVADQQSQSIAQLIGLAQGQQAQIDRLLSAQG